MAGRNPRTHSAGSDELQTPVAILGDLSGPKIRLGEIAGGEVSCVEGTTMRFVRGTESSDPHDLTCTYEQLIDDVDMGDRILLADGTVGMLVTGKADDGDSVTCLVVEPGVIRSRQGVNLPGVTLSTPSITDKDKADLAWALDHQLDLIGLSFVRSASDITELKSLIAERNPTSFRWSLPRSKKQKPWMNSRGFWTLPMP